MCPAFSDSPPDSPAGSVFENYTSFCKPVSYFVCTSEILFLSSPLAVFDLFFDLNLGYSGLVRYQQVGLLFEKPKDASKFYYCSPRRGYQYILTGTAWIEGFFIRKLIYCSGNFM